LGILCGFIIISIFIVKSVIRRYRNSPFPWALVFGIPSALLVVFIIAVLLNTAVLPSFNAPLSKKVNIGLSLLIPIISTLFTFVFYYYALKLYRKRWAKIALSGASAIAVVAAIMGYSIPEERYTVAGDQLHNPPNVLIITIDALRRDCVSFYEEGLTETPNLDGFAEKSIVFKRAYTPSPWTIPSMYSMLTSHYPSVHGADDHHRGNDNLVNLAQVLKTYGYSTEAYVANSIMDRELGFDRGFDTYLMYEDTAELTWARYSTLYLFVARITGEESYFAPPPDTTKWLTDILTRKLSKKRDKPFFIWAHYLDPHGPLTPPLEFAEDKLEITADVKRIIETGKLFRNKGEGLALYEAEVEYVDYSLGEVFGVLEENGLYDNTIIVIASDHGEEFFEHGRYGHARTHYNEVMAIPFFVYFPDKNHYIDDTPVTIMDIAPTIFSHIGIQVPDDVSGRDILKEEKDNGADVRDIPSFFDRTRYDYSVKSVCIYPYTLIRTGDVDYDYEMVDIRIGIGPEDIVKEREPILLAKYGTLLDTWAEETAEETVRLGGAHEVEIDNIRKERLEGLGYF
jgi:arylsulfatase A-like enzyme